MTGPLSVPWCKMLLGGPASERFVRPQEGVGVKLLTDKPTGSVIDVTLSWPAPPDSRLWRYFDRLLMVLFLCGWAWTLVRPAGQLANGNLDFFLVGRVGFLTLCGGLCVWTLLASFRPPRPESVRL